MCYIMNSSSKNRRTDIIDNYMEDWIGIGAAAGYLNRTNDTNRNQIKKQIIRHIKLGKLWKFQRVELEEWM